MTPTFITFVPFYKFVLLQTASIKMRLSSQKIFQKLLNLTVILVRYCVDRNKQEKLATVFLFIKVIS